MKRPAKKESGPRSVASRKTSRASETSGKVKKVRDELEIVSFDSPRTLRTWLHTNHAASPGIWLRIYKKDSGATTVTYAEALDEALSFGWIDGQRVVGDDRSFLQRFTPRRARSGWSKRNTEHVERLIAANRMMPAGLAQVEAAKADGRWHTAYSAFSAATVPDYFVAELRKNRRAHAFFKTLNRTNLYSIIYRLETAKKPETRLRRMVEIIERLARQEKFH